MTAPFLNISDRKKGLLFILALSASFVFCYSGTFLWLHHKYQGPESYYSHGYLVPFISAYLIYQLRNRISAAPLSSAPVGIIIIVLALAIHVFGALGDINFISAFSLVIYLTGCSLFFLGRAVTKIIAFPLFFLVFMCPVPDAYLNVIALPLKSLATSCSLSIIDLLGIPYIREGFRLILPDAIFVVGTPCNGMRSLMSLSAVGLLFVYLIRSVWWKKLIFLSLILPFSILLNGLRIAVLLLIAYGFGQNAADPESFIHDGSGIMVFIIGLCFLILVGRKINEEKRP